LGRRRREAYGSRQLLKGDDDVIGKLNQVIGWQHDSAIVGAVPLRVTVLAVFGTLCGSELDPVLVNTFLSGRDDYGEVVFSRKEHALTYRDITCVIKAAHSSAEPPRGSTLR